MTLICLCPDEECLALLLPSINLLSSSLLVVDTLYYISVTHFLHDAPIGTAVRSGEDKKFRLRKDEVFNKQRLPRAWRPTQDQWPVGLTHVVLDPRLQYRVRIPILGLLRGG